MSTLQQRLKQAMGKKHRPTDLATACNISRAAVAKWLNEENPVQEIKAAHIFAVARLCDVDAEWLATGHGRSQRAHSSNPDKLPPKRLALIQAYATLPPEVRHPIRMLIENLAAAGNPRYAKYSNDEMQRVLERDKETT